MNSTQRLCLQLPCPFSACDPSRGTPVEVTLGQTATAEFALDKGDSIVGTLRAAGSGDPIDLMRQRSTRCRHRRPRLAGADGWIRRVVRPLPAIR